MTCDTCPKDAVYHVTEVVDGKPISRHLCQSCRRGEWRGAIHFSTDDVIMRPAVEKRMSDHHVPGLALCVIEQGEIAFVGSYGVTEIGGDPITEETRFQAASVSKPVTALAAMQLVESGELSLDGDIDDSMTSWKIPQNAFTRERCVSLRTILSHTAGLTVHGFAGYAPTAERPELLAVLNGTPPANSPGIVVDRLPGSGFRYSGGGFCVLQQAMIDVTGTSFPAAMSELVLTPLGMKSSSFNPVFPDRRAFPVACAHHGCKPIPGKWHLYPELAAAGLWTTPADLSRFIMALQQAWMGRGDEMRIPQSMVREMLTPQVQMPMQGRGAFGLGFGVRGTGRTRCFQHDGQNAGFLSRMIGFVETGQGVAIMMNSDTGSELLEELTASVAAAFDWPTP